MTCRRGYQAVAGLAFLGLVFSAESAARAQTTSASVSGVVADSQGAVLPGVSVTLTSHTQGQTLTTTTNGEGRFTFAIVRPDTYSLQASLQGFRTVERTKVVVNANDRLSLGNLVLEVGSMTEEISVTARVSELQTTSGERSFALEAEALQNIANDGRSLFSFTALVPGVLPQAGNGGTNMSGAATDATGFTVNGQRPNSNNMTIDGVANIDTGNNGGNMATTNIDAVSEFKILTNSYQAEYGRAVGGQVQVVTKSGTQQFHGSGYWYGRRSGWNAETWTNNRAGIKSPEASRDDSGYTVGGPVFIPGAYNPERKKLFFFWSQEFQRRNDPVGERRARVPTALERRGDFSQSVDGSGSLFPYIRDFTTGLPCNASNTSGCFQDGGVIGRIPQNRLYAPGMAALNIFPQPNTNRGSGLNYASQAPDQRPRREELLRLDYQATDSWRVTGRYMHNKDEWTQPYGTTWAGAGSNNLDTINTLQLIPGTNFLVSALGVLSNSTSLEVSVGRAHNSLDFVIQNENLTRSAAGLSGMPLLFGDAVQQDLIPWVRFNGGRTTNDAGHFQTDRGPFTNQNTTWDILANLTKVWGAHAAKFGVYYQNSFKPQSIFSGFNSEINFIDDANNPFDTGYGYANAATGVFNTYTQASKYAVPEWRYTNLEWYAQDNWKVNRLTLDYGMRFYFMTPQWDKSLQSSNFVPELFDFSNPARLYFPICIGASPCSGANRRGMDPRLIQQGVTPSLANTVVERFIGRLVPGSNRFNGSYQAGQGIEEELQDGNSFKLSPRLGATYDITGKAETILRGGWGIFYDRPQGNMVFDMGANAPGVLVSTLQWGRLQDLTAAGGDPFTTLSLNPTAFDFRPPKVTQWNIGLQHKLWYELILDVAYVGSESKDLLRRWQENAVPLGAKFLPQNQDPTRAPSATPGATALPDDFLRPFPGYSNIQMWDYSSRGNYHALQLGVNRRYDRGVMFSAFYVRSRALSLEQNNDFGLSGAPSCQCGPPNFTAEQVEELDWSYAPYNRPHNFVTNFVYQMPAFTSGALGLVTNDWQVSGIYRWSSGVPYSITYQIPGIGAANLTGNNGSPSARVVVTGDPGSGSSNDPYRQIDNPLVFRPPSPGSQGNESDRFFLHGPAINNLDLSLSKRFRFKGDAGFEIRFDLFNALNHTQWTGVNARVDFRSLTDPTITNLPYDASGNLVNQNGFGTIQGVRPPRTLQLVTRVTF
jgi:Carboxypeptidase regulatory-like domain/TonB-dependent Receptor Plug Domain